MSIVRWGTDNSSVYIICEDMEKGLGFRCVGCDGPGASSYEKEPFLAHLKWHRDKGDCVPAFVDDEIRNYDFDNPT